MTKILYNKAVKTFIDAIGKGYDEHGAYDKVEKKHGKVLADAVWAEAQTEMKVIRKNPRNSNELIKFLQTEYSIAEVKAKKGIPYAIGYKDAMKTVIDFIKK